MTLSPKVLVVIPAYNEERTIGEVVKSTKSLYPEWDVIVIDDGSDDRTAKNAIEAGADLISLPFHCGGSPVMYTGYLTATTLKYDFLVKIDADGQHKPENIVKLLDPLLKDEADITVGSRYIVATGHDSTVKESGRLLSSLLVSLLCHTEVTDVTSGMRAWNRKAVSALLHIYMERGFIEGSVLWVVETLLMAKRRLRLREVSIEALPRSSGKSKSFALDKMLFYPIRLIITLLKNH